MSQSFIKRPDNGPHSALVGLGVLAHDANDEAPHVMSALNAGATRAPAPDDLKPDELALLAQVDEEFADCGETTVDPAVLLDFAKRGYLECSRFDFTKKGAQAVFRYIHGDTTAAGVNEDQHG